MFPWSFHCLLLLCPTKTSSRIIRKQCVSLGSSFSGRVILFPLVMPTDLLLLKVSSSFSALLLCSQASRRIVALLTRISIYLSVCLLIRIIRAWLVFVLLLAEVMKVLRAKKSAKTKSLHQESVHENLQTVQEKLIDSGAETQRDKENTNQVSIYLSTFKRIAKGILLTQSEFETCTGFLSFISIYPFSHTYISMHLMLVRLKIFRWWSMKGTVRCPHQWTKRQWGPNHGGLRYKASQRLGADGYSLLCDMKRFSSNKISV